MSKHFAILVYRKVSEVSVTLLVSEHFAVLVYQAFSYSIRPSLLVYQALSSYKCMRPSATVYEAFSY